MAIPAGTRVPEVSLYRPYLCCPSSTVERVVQPVPAVELSPKAPPSRCALRKDGSFSTVSLCASTTRIVSCNMRSPPSTCSLPCGAIFGDHVRVADDLAFPEYASGKFVILRSTQCRINRPTMSNTSLRKMQVAVISMKLDSKQRLVSNCLLITGFPEGRIHVPSRRNK